MPRHTNSRPLILKASGLVLLFLLMTKAGVLADPPSPPRTFIPIIVRDFQVEQLSIADLTWQWLDTNGTSNDHFRDVVIFDWDGDGRKEIALSRYNAIQRERTTITVWRSAEQEQFAQLWSMVADAGWGIGDADGDDENEIWTIDTRARLLIFDAFAFVPEKQVQLFLQRNWSIVQGDVVDLFGDDHRYFVLWSVDRYGNQSKLEAFQLPSFKRIWEYEIGAQGCNDRWQNCQFVVAQTDADSGHEIILNSGLVIDPALNKIEWSLPDGFGEYMVTGDIDGDGKAELLSTVWQYTTGSVNAYDLDAKSRKWQIPLSQPSRVQIADVWGDADLEILVRNQNLTIYEAATMTPVQILSSMYGETNLVVGDVNGDGELEYVWGGSNGSDRGLTIQSVHAETPFFRSISYDAPFMVWPIQSDTDPPSELLIGGRFVVDGYNQPQGIEYRAAPAGTITEAVQDFNFAMGNLDTDPEAEFAVSILGYGAFGHYYALDHTGTILAQAETPPGAGPIWAGDLDGDSTMDVVTLRWNGTNEICPLRLQVLRFQDLTPERYDGVSAYCYINQFGVADIDGDGTNEILLRKNTGHIYIINSTTFAEKGRFNTITYPYAVTVGDANGDGDKEIVVIEGEYIVFYDASTLERLFERKHVNSGALWFALVKLAPTSHPQLLITDSTHVYIYWHPYDSRPQQTLSYTLPKVIVSDIEKDGRPDIIISHNEGVSILRAKSYEP